MINDTSIVVLTPVKNEDWILDSFLKVTSLFADHIIIADQNSTDNTKVLAAQYPKVTYILNSSNNYDEEHRQILLIEKARELVPGKKLLIAIDADEIITGDSIDSKEWKIICAQKPGTQVYFKKPDALPGLKKIYDYSNFFLLGFLDDGRKHEGTKFHSPRVPNSDLRYDSKYIKFLHLALARDKEYNARQRLYMILENVNQTDSLRLRYRKYSRYIQHLLREEIISPLPNSWKKNAGKDIIFGGFVTKESNNFNLQIIEKFNMYGSKKFWMEDIWYVDYDDIAAEMNLEIVRRIEYPPFYINFLRSAILVIYGSLLRCQKFFVNNFRP